MDALTDQLNNLISTEISADAAWSAIPGGLDKVSSSSLGFAWGIGSNQVWVCQLPCGGNWKSVPIPDMTSVIDIVTDENVYVLFQSTETKLAFKSANNVNDWIIVSAKPGITRIANTSSYIWGQAGTQKWKLPKPGTTGNWIAVADPLNVTITSASSTSLYGVNAKGQAMKTDESLQSAWSTIPEFGGKFTDIIGSADQTALYGIDSSKALQRCQNGKCSLVVTEYTPQNITVEPISKQLWMTTTTSGNSGNIFIKSDNPDYSNILQSVQPLDKARDDLTRDIEAKYTQTTYATMMSKQLEIIRKILQNMFDFDPKKQNADSQKAIGSELKDTTLEIDQLSTTLPFIKDILIMLLAVIIVYVVGGSFLGDWTHPVALVTIVSGIIYFATR
jgi:hypothetical protein